MTDQGPKISYRHFRCTNTMQPEMVGQSFRPSRGGRLLPCDQDFCEGAKVLNSTFPAFSTPSTSSFGDFTDDWQLDSGTLEVFNEVILPSDDFEDPFGQNLINEIDFSNFDNYVDLKTTGSIADSPQPKTEIDKSNITIRLKKIKCRKQNHSSPSYSAEFVFPVDTSDTLSSDCCSEDLSTLSSFPAFSDSVLEQEMLIGNDTRAPSSSPLTLKEIMDNMDADNLLTDYLHSQITSPSSDTTRRLSSESIWSEGQSSLYDNSDLSLVDDSSPFQSRIEDFSPSLSSTNLSIEDWSSSCTSPNLSIEELSSPFPLSGSPDNPYSPLNELSLSNGSENSWSPQELDSSITKNEVKSQKPKKGRQKLSPESRYLRKKEQNKQAALRYRAKKKNENDEMQNSFKVEEKRREELEDKYSKLKQEMAFIKNLMREVCINKNLVPANAFD